jgi:AcrR family transcriptional regulator
MPRSAPRARTARALTTDDGTPQRIERAALELFDRNGVEATGIQQVCRRSGATVGSVYHHFGSKDGLVRVLFNKGLGHYRAGLAAAVSSAPDARSWVVSLVTFHLCWAADNPAWARLIHRVRHAPAVRAREEHVRSQTGQFLREMAEPLMAHVASGAIRRLPRELYVPLLLGPAQQLVQQWADGRIAVDLAAVAPQVAQAAWRAVAAAEPLVTKAAEQPARVRGHARRR